ncbi:alpha/beta hydrolase [Candidatus Saccharibacteria bacterium]|nr:alpha/beta hydrolase [Candidatus Saccharibacteria bacterium]
MNTIIVHGSPDSDEYYSDEFPSASNSHWLPWLQKQLMIKDIKADTPEMMFPFKPDYDHWKTEAERFEIGPDTMLVGHSCGGGFWVRYLSEHPDLKVGKVVLVAPWLDPNNVRKTDFFDFEIDPDLVKRTKGITIFNSTNDHQGIHWSVEMIRQSVKDIKYVEFDDYGHFCLEDMHTEAFPELLAELLDS